MFICEKSFNFVDRINGITKDGEKYISISVIDPEDNRKYSFLTTDEKLISKISNIQIARFNEITLILGFEKVFNSRTRFSNWNVYLVGVK